MQIHMPMQITGHADVWDKLTVVCTSVMALPLVRAFLTGGARVVVCRDEAAPEPERAQALAFFDRFYAELFAGRAILRALALAGVMPSRLAHQPCL